MKNRRNIIITAFVILWCAAFHYESARHFYLNPLFERPLPKIKFLFPPAGWIMFYKVGRAYGTQKIFGIKGEQAHEIDPHEIFRVRTIGFDNIQRGVISGAASQRNRWQFCRQLFTRFPDYDDFRVLYAYYPDFIDRPLERRQKLIYGCAELRRNDL